MLRIMAPSPTTPMVVSSGTAARNAPCPCGSGRKYKRCCGITKLTYTNLASFEPVTESGRLLEAFSPLRHALQHNAGQPASRPNAGTRASQTAQAWLNLAARHEAAGKWEEAIGALQTAARLEPENAVAHYNLGLTARKMNRPIEAVSSLRQAISLKPDFGRAHFQLGVALQDLGHDLDAIEAFRSAIALRTRLAEAHSHLGDLLLASGDANGAVENYRKASNDTTRGRLNAAKALMAEERLEEAEGAARRAAILDRQSGEAEWVLGNILSLQGHFDDAVRHCDRAIELVPEAAGAYYTRAMARRATEADRPVIARMEGLLESATLNAPARMKLLYALGKAYDDIQDYAAAIRHFDAANRIDEASCSYDRAQITAWVDLLIGRCNTGYFAQHSELGLADETPVLIVGMPRSGTTLVEQIVSSHPLVEGAGELEFWLHRGPDWEHSGPAGLAEEVVRRLADDYLAVLRRAGPNAMRVTDKLPHNFMRIGLIHLAFPRARIIHCRRHPVDTCLSIYFTHFLRRTTFASHRSNLVFEYRLYERLMAHWRSVLPADRLLEVDYEALVADRETATRRLIEFCGLPWDPICLKPERNARVVRTASMWQARQPVYRSSVGRWRNYEPWLGELRELLPPATVGGSAIEH